MADTQKREPMAEADNAELKSAGGSLSLGPWPLAALVFAAAMAARLGYLAQIGASPFYDITILKGGDSFRFMVWALDIVENGWIGEGVFNQSPLYPYFMALIYKLGGMDLITPRLAQMFMGSLGAAMAFAAARRLAGNLAGMVGGLCLALDGAMIFYDGAMIRAGMLAFLNIALVLAMIEGRRKPGVAYGFAAGALFALGLLAKPNIAVMAPALAAWVADIFLMERRAGKTGDLEDKEGLGDSDFEREDSVLDGPGEDAGKDDQNKLAAHGHEEGTALAGLRRRDWLRTALGLAAGALLVMSFLFTRNILAGLPPTALTQRGAIEFITGNHPRAPLVGWQPSPEIERLTEESGNSLPRSVFVVFRLYKDRPFGLVERQLRKTWAFVYGYEAPSNYNYEVERRYVPWLRLPWLNWPIIFGLAAAGFFTIRRNWREGMALHAMFVLYTAGSIAFYMTARFRVPIVPLACVYAGLGAGLIVEKIREGDRLRAAGLVVLAVALIGISSEREADPIHPSDYRNMVRFHLIHKEEAEARRVIEGAKLRAREIVAEDDTAYGRYRLARLLFTAGDPLDQVLAECGRARLLGPSEWLGEMIRSLENNCARQRAAGDPKKFGFRL